MSKTWDDFSEQKPDRDLGLEVEGKIFWVSRKELAESSPVFEKMLFGQFQESEKEIVQLSNKSAQEILEFLRCLFPTGTEVKKVDDENVNLLLSLADEYEFMKSTEKCTKFLTAKIERASDDEKIDLFVVGVQYKLRPVVRGTMWWARKAGAASIPHFDEMPTEVKNAITMSVPVRVNTHERRFKAGWYRGYYYNTCEYCPIDLGPPTKNRPDYVDDEGPCPVCHSCLEYIEVDPDYDDEDKPMTICHCLDRSVWLELRKVGLWDFWQ